MTLRFVVLTDGAAAGGKSVPREELLRESARSGRAAALPELNGSIVDALLLRRLIVAL